MSAPSQTQTDPVDAADAVRASILSVADRLLADGGEPSFSIRNLVAHCGHSAPVIYRHFRDKSHLTGELLEARLAMFASELRRIPEPLDPVDHIVALGHLFADFGRTCPAYYRLFTLASIDGGIDPPSGEVCRELLSRPLDRLAESGRVESADLDALKQAFWALIHGVVMLQVTRPEYAWEDRLLDVGLKGLIAGTVDAHGIRPDAAETQRPSKEQVEEGA